MARRTGTAAPEKLSREAIVGGALALADREGLDAVTIRRLAEGYAVTPMALYWHFKDKDRLLDGIAERLFSDVVLPEDTRGSWHQRLRHALDAVLAALRPHPAVAVLAQSRILNSDAGLAVADHVLGLLRDARFSREQAAEVGSYLLSSIITLIAAEPGPDPALDEDGREQAIRQKRASLAALSPVRFPNVTASAGALASCANEDAYFSRGLNLLVQGTRGVQPR